MKTILFPKYGSPDVLQYKDVPKLTPDDDQILIKIHTASANPLDWHRMRGAPFLVRLEDGLRKPKNQKLGADVAGQVESVGKNVTQFKVGDEVFGEIGSGAFAEYVCVRGTAVVLKSPKMSFVDAAAMPVASLTAVQALRNKGQLQAGQKVLINGASGGVGTYAVQIAKALGAEVTAVCSTRNIELVRSLGAEHVVDYTQEDFSKKGQRYDLILDNVGNLSISHYKRALASTGKVVIVGFTTLPHMFNVLLRGAWLSKTSARKIGTMLAQPNQEDLNFMSELFEAGKVKSVIDKCYPLAETAEAIRYLETGRARGKVIINVVTDSQS